MVSFLGCIYIPNFDKNHLRIPKIICDEWTEGWTSVKIQVPSVCNWGQKPHRIPKLFEASNKKLGALEINCLNNPIRKISAFKQYPYTKSLNGF